MDAHGDALAQARRATAARDWPTAAAQFDVLESEQLTADDLAAHADAVWWLGRTEDALRLGAAAYDAFLADSRPVEAAMRAMRLGVLHLARGDEQQGAGWLGHAGRLAEGIPECALHGYVAGFTEVELSLIAGEPAAAVDAARRVQDIGRRFDTPELVAQGLHGEGRALIKSGHVGDVRRMTRWTDLTERWLASLTAAVVFNAMCRFHRAHVQLLRGEWDDAERGALEVVALLDTNRVDYAAEAWYVIAEVRRLRGDPSAADAYDEAHARGRDPQPGRALLRPPQGGAAGGPARGPAAG